MIPFRKKKPQTMPGRRHQAVSRPEATPVPPAYRRNRTMTDRSSIPEVSDRARIHHLRLVRRKIGMILGVTTGVLLVIVIGVSQFTQSVKLISSDNATMVQQPVKESYVKLIDEYYRSHPIERFRFSTNYDQLSAWVQESNPEVAGIVPTGIDSLGVARYEVRFRKPIVSWRVNDERYYVDMNGVTFKKNYFSEPTVAVVDRSGVHVEQGAAIASNRLLSFVGRAVALASQNSIKVTQVEIPSRSMRQVYIYGDKIPIVRMTIDRGVEPQVADMIKSLRYFADKNETPAYIDVRTPGRAFYR